VLPVESRRSRLSPPVLAFLLPLVIGFFPPPAPVSAGPLAAEVIRVFCPPDGGAAEAVVRELGNARREILVQAYSLTSEPVAKALVAAHQRGVKITAVLDTRQLEDRFRTADFMSRAGIPTYVDNRHAIGDTGILIIDQATILTSTPDARKATEGKDAEILLVIKGNASLVKERLADFKDHLEHSDAIK
jgi:phosphatidylserine/phosphatidylglycerophosphate/cardiolipin synthase-like enzyme